MKILLHFTKFDNFPLGVWTTNVKRPCWLVVFVYNFTNLLSFEVRSFAQNYITYFEFSKIITNKHLNCTAWAAKTRVEQKKALLLWLLIQFFFAFQEGQDPVQAERNPPHARQEQNDQGGAFWGSDHIVVDLDPAPIWIHIIH